MNIREVRRDLDSSKLAQMLPMEENFLMLFRINHPLDSSVEFMKVSKKNRCVVM